MQELKEDQSAHQFLDIVAYRLLWVLIDSHELVEYLMARLMDGLLHPLSFLFYIAFARDIFHNVSIMFTVFIKKLFR